MTFESAILYFAYLLIGLWSISFIYNIFYFLNKSCTPLDKACFNKSRSFEEALEDLSQLEIIKKKKFNSARQKILFYENNAKLTKRKYLYYADRIEEGFIKLYLGKFLSKKDVFKKLDQPVRIHFIFLFIFSGLVLLLFITIFTLSTIINFGLGLFMVGSILTAAYIRFFIYIISINCAFFYGLMNLILYLTKVDRSKLFKNTGILNFLTKNWSGFNTENMVIGAAAVGSFHSYSGSGFGGFGGGSFGGGGAGGSW
ncbi:MAG: hypothetical protein RJQ00_05290 [Vicingaceae bacterium]